MPFTVAATDREQAGHILSLAERIGAQLELRSVQDRVDLFRLRLRIGVVSLHDFLAEVRVLRETFDKGLKFQYFDRYSDEKAHILLERDRDWGAAFAKFPELKEGIVAALDCYAVGHYLASVFYLMRVMETAVQIFGKTLGVNLVKKHPGRKVSELNWEQILNDLNPKLKAIPQTTERLKRRYEKFAAMQSHLYNVKDAWRNPTMHPRPEGYSDRQCEDVILNVRSFLSQFAEIYSPPKKRAAVERS